MHRVYLDNAATTPLHPAALEAMMPYFSDSCFNPSAGYSMSAAVMDAVEHAREQVAHALGAKSQHIIFTSGGTESNNLAILGYARRMKPHGKHIITTQIEHKSVLNACKQLAKEGFEVTYLPVDKMGLISLEHLRTAMRPDTILVSVMAANNEIGTIQPLVAIGKLCRNYNPGVLAYHVDAVQAVGQMTLNVQLIGCDFMSISAHKFHGPKGVGALYARHCVEPILYGGDQEKGVRAGTLNVPGIIGMGKAIELADRQRSSTYDHLSRLQRCMSRQLAGLQGVHLNGCPIGPARLPSNISLTIDGVDASGLLASLELYGILASAGSACNTASMEPSYVLNAIGLTDEQAWNTIRLSMSDQTTTEDVEYVCDRMIKCAEQIRSMNAG